MTSATDHPALAPLRAFNEPDAEKRRVLLEATCAPDVAYIDPDWSVVGVANLDDIIAAFHQKAPAGWRFSLIGQIDTHHNLARVTWGFGPPGGLPAATGIDVVILDNDRIQQLHVFFDPPPNPTD
jgi:hypothetical protein